MEHWQDQYQPSDHGQDARRGDVSTEMERLDKAVQNHASTLDRLFERIGPVRQPKPSDIAEGAEPEIAISALGSEIRTIRRAVEYLTKNTMGVLEEVEL